MANQGTGLVLRAIAEPQPSCIPSGECPRSGAAQGSLCQLGGPHSLAQFQGSAFFLLLENDTAPSSLILKEIISRSCSCNYSISVLKGTLKGHLLQQLSHIPITGFHLSAWEPQPPQAACSASRWPYCQEVLPYFKST